MSGLDVKDGKKIINAFVMIVSIILAFILIRFFQQMGEWFDLEAKVQYFNGLSQALGGLVGLVAFVALTKNKKTSSHLNEVYGELTKVVWPKTEQITRVTIAILIGVAIASGIFVLIDWLSREFLGLIY